MCGKDFLMITMFEKLYLYLAVLSVNLALGVCYVNYDLFEGFKSTTEAQRTFMWHYGPHKKDQLVSTMDYEETKPTVSATLASLRREINFTTSGDYYETTPGVERKKPAVNVKEFNMKCPENEKPISLGTYEIPTQRDLVLFTQRTLLNMFNNYHTKTLLLLKDIKEATRATATMEKKCHGSGKGLVYKKCVKQVNMKFVTVTKELVQTLERQEAEVVALTEGKICDLASMKTNPIQLIKTLAMDEAALVFALPAFLRLLGGCSVHCNKPPAPDHRPRLRQMTDQELVVRHFLTNKNYLQLLKDKTNV